MFAQSRVLGKCSRKATILLIIAKIIKAAPTPLVQSFFGLTLAESTLSTSTCLDVEGGAVSKTTQSLLIRSVCTDQLLPSPRYRSPANAPTLQRGRRCPCKHLSSVFQVLPSPSAASRQPHSLPPNYPLPSGLWLWSIPGGLFYLAGRVRRDC